MKNKAVISVTAFGVALVVAGLLVHERRNRAALRLTGTILAQVAEASEYWETDNGSYPTNIVQLRGGVEISWPRTSLKRESQSMKDGWGHPLVYHPFDITQGFGSVASLGRDGKPGGKRADADTEVVFPRRK